MRTQNITQVYEEKTVLHFFALWQILTEHLFVFFVYILKLKCCLSFFLRNEISLQPPGDVKKRVDMIRI